MIRKLAILFLLTTFQTVAADEYPRRDLLVEPDAAKVSEFVIIDARSRPKYAADHLPGAMWVDHETWSKEFGAQQKPDDWGKRIGGLGIGPKSKVLIYDDAMSKDAARIWYILRYFGVRDVRLLNGGWPAWKAANLSTTEKAPEVNAVAFLVVAEPRRFADQSVVLGVVKDKSRQIVDARSEAEHCGDDKKAKKGGHIPGAIHLEWSDALDKKSQKFKSPEQLKAILKEAGIDVARPIVTHCQSGGRSSVMAFTLELMGAESVSNYYRGWSEWGNSDDAPIEATPKKK